MELKQIYKLQVLVAGFIQQIYEHMQVDVNSPDMWGKVVQLQRKLRVFEEGRRARWPAERFEEPALEALWLLLEYYGKWPEPNKFRFHFEVPMAITRGGLDEVVICKLLLERLAKAAEIEDWLPVLYEQIDQLINGEKKSYGQLAEELEQQLLSEGYEEKAACDIKAGDSIIWTPSSGARWVLITRVEKLENGKIRIFWRLPTWEESDKSDYEPQDRLIVKK